VNSACECERWTVARGRFSAEKVEDPCLLPIILETNTNARGILLMRLQPCRSIRPVTHSPTGPDSPYLTGIRQTLVSAVVSVYHSAAAAGRRHIIASIASTRLFE
jgi:hypothetical protein